MSEPERLRRTFMAVSDDSSVSRVVSEVNLWLTSEPERLRIAKEAMLEAANTPLKNPECEAADVAKSILVLSKRDVSDKGYSREKLLGLLRSRCGPLGNEEADKLVSS
ncbi:hypothetical protein TrLO_g16017 [Triparma laevis f. longispina]|uniref:Uncharacterized protein n=1 Tax=Triparma laevis f. longispina TaxID=1714387 RepID=A0A9W7BZH7_9STRA|nr:hypothetical protein TrLO_g16017 [Triparma laevis f. longispina]